MIKPCTCYVPFEMVVQQREFNNGDGISFRPPEVRIVCMNCGRATSWCDSVEDAAKMWNGGVLT